MSNKKELLQKKQEYEEQVNNCVDIFNTICQKIGEHLTSEFPGNRDLNIYNDVVNNVIKKNPTEAISIFLVNIYSDDKYRESILDGDEKFFIKNNHNALAKNDKDAVQAIFNFQSCWGKMNVESKTLVKDSMKALVNICETYLEAKDELNKLKKM